MHSKKRVQNERLCFDKFRREQCSRELAPALQKGTEHAEQRGVAWYSLIDRKYLKSYKKTRISAKTCARRAAALTAAARTRKLTSLVEFLKKGSVALFKQRHHGSSICATPHRQEGQKTVQSAYTTISATRLLKELG